MYLFYINIYLYIIEIHLRALLNVCHWENLFVDKGLTCDSENKMFFTTFEQTLYLITYMKCVYVDVGTIYLPPV